MESPKHPFGDTMSNSTDIDFSLYPRWNDSCIWRTQDEGLLIFKIEQQSTQGDSEEFTDIRHIVLNREGKDAWMLCTGVHTGEEIVNMLKKEYEGDEKSIQKDVTEMIATLLEEGYLLLEDSPHPARHDLDEKAYPKRSDDAIANVVEDNFVIMSMKTSHVYSFDKNVEYLWDICDGIHTVGEILSTAANTDETLFLLNFLIRLGFLELKNYTG